MNDAECIAFLQWAAPRLGLRWAGFRRVRRQVCKRIVRRCAALALADLAAYQRWCEEHPDEWPVLDGLCRVTISRFARDRGVWAALVGDVLPRLAREAGAGGRRTVTAWSAGCGAGEEPYTLAIAWALAPGLGDTGVALDVLASDLHEGQLARAAAAVYPAGTLRELPQAWRRVAFEPGDGHERLRARFRGAVRFVRHDVRAAPPGGPFDLILCRNLAFTYLEEAVQGVVAAGMRAALRPGGVLVVGVHERVPDGVAGLTAAGRCLYVRDPDVRAAPGD